MGVWLTKGRILLVHKRNHLQHLLDCTRPDEQPSEESQAPPEQELPLYCIGGLRFFWDNKFDHAMVAFLDCVQQFKEEVEKGDMGFCLPYRMDVK
ncbi:beclin-1-like [Salvelinus alpinus]